MATFKVHSPNVQYTSDFIESRYIYETTKVTCNSKGGYIVHPVEKQYTFRTERRVPKVGCMLVGWGGNNGCTITAAVLANKLGLSWDTKHGVKVTFPLFCACFREVYPKCRRYVPRLLPNGRPVTWGTLLANAGDQISEQVAQMGA